VITDDEIAIIKKDNNRLRNAIYKLISVSGLDGKPVSVKKVQEAVELAKLALKSTSKKSYE
jgi:hypothetical protein